MPDYTGDIAFQTMFKAEFLDLLEQKKSILYDCVRSEPDAMEGKWAYFDRLGGTEWQQQTERHGDTPIIELPHSRRMVYRTTYDWGTMVDRADARKIARGPSSRLVTKYAMKALRAYKRLIDDIIIGVFDGNAISIDADEAQSNVAFDTANSIAVDFQYGGGGSASGLTVQKITRVFELLAGNEVDMDETTDLFAVVGPRQWADLLNLTQLQSRDTSPRRQLIEPNMINFMGFNWKRSNRLELSSGTNDRKCFFWHRDGIGFAGDSDPIARYGENPSKKYQSQAYMEAELGAVRVEEDRVIRVLCDETV